MQPAERFFLIALTTQLVFTAAVVVLVGRRYPARIALYRWVAPAGVPVLLFGLLSYAFVSDYFRFLAMTHVPFNLSVLTPMILRFALAYAILWLVGVLFAQLLTRWLFRRR